FLMFDHVQPTLLLERARPTAGSVIISFTYRLSARPAADAWITLVMKSVIGNLVLVDKGPHVLLAPAQKRVHLHQVEFGVPLHDACGCSMRRLIAADGADPGIPTSKRSPERQNFAIIAALVRPDAIQRPAMLGFVLGNRQLRTYEFYLNSVSLFNTLPQLQGF